MSAAPFCYKSMISCTPWSRKKKRAFYPKIIVGGLVPHFHNEHVTDVVNSI